VDRFAVTALYLFALGVFAAPALANVALGLLLLAAAAQPHQTLRLVARHPASPALLALGLLLTAQAAGLALSTGLSGGDVAVLADLAKLTLLLPLGLAVAGKSSRAGRALALAGLSLLLCMALHARPSELWQALSEGHTRLGFGLPAIAFGLYAATALLGVLLLVPTYAARLPSSPRRALLVAAGAALALIGMGLLACRSRGAWLALALTLPPCAVWAWRRGGVPRPALAGLGAVLLVGLVMNGEALARRLADDSATYRALVGLSDVPATGTPARLAALPADSVGLRLRLSGLALERWLEHPWFGRGPDAGRQVIAQADDPELAAMSHLHNTYLELMVRFGVVGLAGFGAVLVGLGLGLQRAVRSGALPPQLGVFLGGALAVALVWSAFDFRLLTQDFRFYTVLLAGIAFGLGLPRREAPCAS
jgi:O-antigen ligase